MFANSMMGFPNINVAPSATPIPIPYPNIGLPSGEISSDFNKWSKSARLCQPRQIQASKELDKSFKALQEAKGKAAKAIDELTATLDRIAQLQAAQKKTLATATKLEADVAKAFKQFEKTSKSGDSKAKEAAKATLIGKGLAFKKAFVSMETLRTSLLKEQSSLDKALKAVK